MGGWPMGAAHRLGTHRRAVRCRAQRAGPPTGPPRPPGSPARPCLTPTSRDRRCCGRTGWVARKTDRVTVGFDEAPPDRGPRQTRSAMRGRAAARTWGSGRARAVASSASSSVVGCTGPSAPSWAKTRMRGVRIPVRSARACGLRCRRRMDVCRSSSRAIIRFLCPRSRTSRFRTSSRRVVLLPAEISAIRTVTARPARIAPTRACRHAGKRGTRVIPSIRAPHQRLRAPAVARCRHRNRRHRSPTAARSPPCRVVRPERVRTAPEPDPGRTR